MWGCKQARGSKQGGKGRPSGGTPLAWDLLFVRLAFHLSSPGTISAPRSCLKAPFPSREPVGRWGKQTRLRHCLLQGQGVNGWAALPFLPSPFLLLPLLSEPRGLHSRAPSCLCGGSEAGSRGRWARPGQCRRPH